MKTGKYLFGFNPAISKDVEQTPPPGRFYPGDCTTRSGSTLEQLAATC